MREEHVVRSAAELKAVTHPLRVRMLAALRADGPATATELARRFDTDTGSTSYHLRQLARYGFVELAAEQRDARERRWAAAQLSTTWDDRELNRTEEGRAVVAAMRRRQLDALTRSIAAFDDIAAMRRDWDGIAGMGDYLIRLTPASVELLWEHLAEWLAERAAADADDPAAEPVDIFAALFPAAGS